MIVTLFKNIKEVQNPYHLKVLDVLSRIKTGESKILIEKIRKTESKEARNELKKNLPSICFSGVFRERKASKIVKYSGLICIDFDNFKTEEDLIAFKDSICDDQFTFASFISPSGDGIKVLVKVPEEKHNHKRYFDGLKEYYDSENFDPSGSDLARVCYESWDPEIFINEESKVFDQINDIEEYDFSDSIQKIPLKEESQIIERLMKWWDKKFGFVEGARNQNIFKLACAFSEYGIKQYTSENYLSKFSTKDFSFNEINRIISSAYSKTKHTFDTKYFEDTSTADRIRLRVMAGERDEEITKDLLKSGLSEDQVKWVLDEAKKNESIDVFWEKNSRGVIKLIPDKMIDFLQEHGFYKYYPSGNEAFIFVYLKNNLIEPTTTEKIKEYLFNYLRENNHIEAYNYFALKTNLFKEDFLNLLKKIEVSMKKDTIDSCYCYFRNCAVEVNLHEIKTIPYLSLDGYVWKDHIVDRDFFITENYENDFEKFLFNIAGKNNLNKKAFENTLGYLLHSYKNKGYSPAIILNDEVISENPEGGTGKGLFVYALTHLKKVVSIDGKIFDKNKTFAYQTVSASTHTLVLDDVKKNFDFEGLFSLITEGITLERKNKDAVKLDFYNSPKIIITTNYAIAGRGSSHDRRRFELELTQHYTLNYTPVTEFGKLLFDQWNDDEWLRFDNYMFHCVKTFLNEGFYIAQFKNLDARKFIQNTCSEFYEWVTPLDGTHILRRERVSKKELYDDFIENFSDCKRWVTQKRFHGFLLKYADFKKVKLLEGNSNGMRWVSLQLNDIDQIIEEILDTPF